MNIVRIDTACFEMIERFSFNGYDHEFSNMLGIWHGIWLKLSSPCYNSSNIINNTILILSRMSYVGICSRIFYFLSNCLIFRI